MGYLILFVDKIQYISVKKLYNLNFAMKITENSGKSRGIEILLPS